MTRSTTVTANQPSNGSPPGRRMRILIALDRSKPAHWAFAVGAKMAHDMGAQVHLVNVFVPASSLTGEFASELERLDTLHESESLDLLAGYRKLLPESVDCQSMARSGAAAQEIVSAAKIVDADLIVIGTRSRGPVTRFLLGSVAEAVVRHAVCPVVTVGHPAEWAAAGRPVEQAAS